MRALRNINHEKIVNSTLVELSEAGITAIHETGSSYTCDPPVLNTDIDLVVRVSDIGFFRGFAVAKGWTDSSETDRLAPTGRRYPPGNFHCFRKGRYNLIVTSNANFYQKYVTATLVCKKLNVLKKEDRVMIFQGITQGAWPSADQLKRVDNLPQDGVLCEPDIEIDSPSYPIHYPPLPRVAPLSISEPSWVRGAVDRVADSVNRTVFHNMMMGRSVQEERSSDGASEATVVPTP